MRNTIQAYIWLILFGFCGCEDSNILITAPCDDDSDCSSGTLCRSGECVSADQVACSAVADGKALLQPDPIQIHFADETLEDATASVEIRNVGSCTLTVFDATLADADSPGFACDACDDETFPIEIYPMRSHPLEIHFSPPAVGPYANALVILSDDAQYPEIHVPLRGHFLGKPQLRVIPEQVDFGYVATGRTVSKSVRLSNTGSGTAPLHVQSITLEPADSTAFSMIPLANGEPTLAPLSEDPAALLDVELRYHPRDRHSHNAELVIVTPAETRRIAVLGSSETPPAIAVDPAFIDFGTQIVGETAVRRLTIQNNGGSPLELTHRWQTIVTDLWSAPAVVGPIQPGQFAELEIFSAPSGPQELGSTVVFESNDPSRASVSVPVATKAELLPQARSGQVIKVEMNYSNGGSNIAVDDWRNVDLSFESPHGQVCGKSAASPTDWGRFGTPKWIAFPPNEEPERILLPDADQDGIYRVMVQYQEDCAQSPTALIANVLGISVPLLISYASGGVVNIDSDKLSEIIDELCVRRDRSAVTVTAYIDGLLVAEVPVELNRKGEFFYPLELERKNGIFEVRR